ncbi:hypothetical protein P1P68_39810 [Streptomyces scabiei]|uniref:hypothetical protein n=1 Tax=Streptomyces scabiei TaxID=1930 RepID=UPI002990808E|nr:hypothetical protein [Streptomyces scabiei]MDW8810787.1 hypothetical protein [Streptomyces scabiei]
MTETKPLERRVDTVLRIGPSDGEDFMLAVEVQGERKPGLTLVSAWLDRAGTVERAEDLFSDRAAETSGEH